MSEAVATRKEGTQERGSDAARIAAAGIRDSEQFAEFMSAVMADVTNDRLSPAAANASINAGGKLLKVVDMRYRYGKGRTLNLIEGPADGPRQLPDPNPPKPKTKAQRVKELETELAALKAAK